VFFFFFFLLPKVKHLFMFSLSYYISDLTKSDFLIKLASSLTCPRLSPSFEFF